MSLVIVLHDKPTSSDTDGGSRVELRRDHPDGPVIPRDWAKHFVGGIPGGEVVEYTHVPDGLETPSEPRLANASNRLAQIEQMIKRGDDQASILAAIDRAQAALGRAGDTPEILKRKPLHLATCDWGQPVFLSPHQDAIEVAFPNFLIEQGYRVEQDWAEAKDERWATSSTAAERRALETMDPEWAELARRLREVGL